MTRKKTILLTFFYLAVVILASQMLYMASRYTQHDHLAHPLILSPLGYHDHDLSGFWSQIKHRITLQPFNLAALIIFLLTLVHIFCAHWFTSLANRLRKRNVAKNIEPPDTFWVEILRFMGEVEVIFGLWVIPLIITMTCMYDWRTSIAYLNGRNYTEPMFVFVIMAISSTKPIIKLAEECMRQISSIGGQTVKSWWFTILTIGPLLGSFITEPAAMTISAILLSNQIYLYKPSPQCAYATLGLLFTNISVGGVLTNFAAPPVLMVSRPWEWSSFYMFSHFGWKAAIGIVIANAAYYFYFRNELNLLDQKKQMSSQHDNHNDQGEKPIPFWVCLVHVFFLAWIVVHANIPIIFIGSFLLYLGIFTATAPYQNQLNLKTPLLVGFFLAGLIVHGTLQSWWMSPILERASSEILMILCIILTAFNDNAEITFLASLTPGFTESLKYAVMAGAVTGGGLTVIANAPNLSGYALLSRHFKDGISAIGLFLAALFPTIVMALSFYLLRNI